MEPNTFLPPEQPDVNATDNRDPWAPVTDPANEPVAMEHDSSTAMNIPVIATEPTTSSSLFAASVGDAAPAVGHLPPTDHYSETEPAEMADAHHGFDAGFEPPPAPAATEGMFGETLMAPTPAVEVHELVESGPKSRRFEMKKVLGAGLAVAVLAAGSTVAFNQFSSSGPNASGEGGGESPQLVVEQFMAAVEQEDFLGAAEMMEPTERRTMVNPGIQMAGELQRIGVLAEQFDMGAVQGVDVQLGEMVYTPEPLAGSVVRVGVSGEITTVGMADQLPLGPLVTDNMSAEELSEMAEEGSETAIESIDDLGIVTVQRDGSWYISLWYSVAEGIRREEGIAEVPSFGNGPTPVGGDSPETAVQAMADAISNMDVRAGIASLDPQEAAALYDYSTLFLSEAEAELASIGGEAFITIDRLDMSSETNGDDGTVTISGMAATVNFFGESFSVDTVADCIITVDQACEMTQADLAEVGMTSDLLRADVAVRKVGDAWYISPTSSVMNPMLDAMAELDRETIQGWIDNPESMLDAGGSIGVLGPVGIFGIGAVTLLGTTATSQFEEISEAVDYTEYEEFDDGRDSPAEEQFDEVYEELFEEIPPSTTEGPDEPGFTLPDDVADAPEEAPAGDDGPGFTLPGSVAGSSTTVPQTTTVAPVEQVTVYEVRSFAEADTDAFTVDAYPVLIASDDLPAGAITENEVNDLGGMVTLVDLEPGTILRWDHFTKG